MRLEQQNWKRGEHRYLPTDLDLFQALERECVLEVLRRDKALRTIEAERIRYKRYIHSAQKPTQFQWFPLRTISSQSAT